MGQISLRKSQTLGGVIIFLAYTESSQTSVCILKCLKYATTIAFSSEMIFNVCMLFHHIRALEDFFKFHLLIIR